MILAFCLGFFGHTLLNARAEEKAVRNGTVIIPVFRSARRQSLNLATKYAPGEVVIPVRST